MEKVPRLPLLVIVVAVFSIHASPADAQPWRVGLAFGDELWHSGSTWQHGFAALDVQRDRTARGRLHLLYNTDTLQAGLEGIRLADGKLELGFVARGEALLAGLLFDYSRQGERDSGNSFYASYVQLLPSAKWHPAPHHSVGVTLGMRQWFFGRMGGTDPTFTLPPDTFVFEPRLEYVYWNVEAPSEEWEAHRFHPRIRGLAFGVVLGLDRRTDRRAWGADQGGVLGSRNDPGEVILTARHWLYAGARTSTLTRLQLEEHASWGVGEDDLTRNRAGGMNPYVVPIAGLPWASILSERLVAAQLALHVKPREASRHELGLGIDGGVFDDVRRNGGIRRFSGAGGTYAFADLRFGSWQLHGRFGYAFPSGWLRNQPHVSAMITAGVRLR